MTTLVGFGTPAGGIGNVSPGLPAGLAEGDLLELYVESNGGQAASAPDGSWTAMSNSPQDGGGPGETCFTGFWKFAGASEAAPTVADTGNHTFAVIAAYRDVDPTTPYDDTDGAVDEPADTTISVPGGTTTVDGCLVRVLVAHTLDVTTAQVSSWANGDLDDFAERLDVAADAGSGGGISVATGVKTSAGSFGASTATLAASGEKTTHMAALKPVAGGGEEHSGASATTAGGRAVSSGRKSARAQDAANGAGGSETGGEKAAVAGTSVSGGGEAVSQGEKGASAASAASGAGAVTSSGRKNAVATSHVSGGGGASSSGTTAESHSGSSQVSGTGSTTSAGRKGGRAVSTSSGGGAATGAALKAALSTSTASAGGAAIGLGRPARFGASHVSGGGDVLTQTFAGAPAEPAVTTRTRSGGPSGRTSAGPASGRTLVGAGSGRTGSNLEGS